MIRVPLVARLALLSLLLIPLSSAGCGSDTDDGDGDGGGDGDGDGDLGDGDTGDGDLQIPSSGGSEGMGGGGQEVMLIRTLPPGFTPGMESPNEEDPMPARGGYKRVGPLADVTFEQEECANILRGISRDFTTEHDDFGEERADGPNFVLPTLSTERKPVLNTEVNTEIVEFEDWYQNLEGINEQYVVDIWLEPVDGTFVLDTGLFFPLDGVGTETFNSHDEMPHNFHFTTELHTQFEYKGGEYFSFRGDDDVWVFINGRLAVDLGGVHGPQLGGVNLDDAAADLDIQIGGVYPLDMFHAERRISGSNFRIETTLDFTGCGEILDQDRPK